MKQIATLLVLLIVFNANSQEEGKDQVKLAKIDRIPLSDEDQIKELIGTFFQAMTSSDTTTLKIICMEDISLQTTFTARNGNPVMKSEDFNDFLIAVATPKKEVWDERISNLNVQVDDNLGHAWMDYQFYIDITFSHCGVNSFQFIRTIEGWKILSIIDTRRKDPCTTN